MSLKFFVWVDVYINKIVDKKLENWLFLLDVQYSYRMYLYKLSPPPTPRIEYKFWFQEILLMVGNRWYKDYLLSPVYAAFILGFSKAIVGSRNPVFIYIADVDTNFGVTAL